MNITYLENDDFSKVFSFHRHDYKVGKKEGDFIDGGFDYIRFNGELSEDSIENLIGDIREQFTWKANYEKDGVTLRKVPVTKLLKDLDTDHIINILIFFTERINIAQPNYTIGQSWKAYHLIFLHELKYRHENKIY